MPRYLVALGGLLGAVVVAEAAVLAIYPHRFRPMFLVGVATAAPFIVGIAYAGYWLERTDLAVERYGRIWGWCLGGLLSILLFNAGLMVASPPVDVSGVVGWLRWAASVGAGLGLLVGVFDARAVQREAAAQRAAVRAEEAESRQELLDYLNSVLRHEVLNTANVIDGYASLLQEGGDERTPERAAVIRRQTREMERVLRDVRVLVDATRRDTEREPVDLAAVLDDELTKLRDRHGTVETEATIPGEAYVRADALLPRVFSNLFNNAVEHNDSPTPRVSVTVTGTAEMVTVRVADNGPGIPADERDTLFERESSGSPDHGLGLALVDTLVDRYGGSLDLAETGPEGTVFAVELPRATDVPEDPQPTVDGPDASVDPVAVPGER